mmetsp:Transcript_27029/g.50529  ORF Transcript_27029/g.50529 Transcript_27029/m.50529 type:complete len:893 (-) Transcript_27029:266-2944(-)
MDPMRRFVHPENNLSEPVTDADNNKELSFRSKGLTADDIQGISSLLAHAKELDLSDNCIDKLSRGFPLSLIALDLSNNRLPSLAGFENLRNIRMLRLQHNKIASTWGLQECVNLVHLDLTHNRIQVVEGLESLSQLRTLLLTKNYINTMDCIRSLSFNTALEDLSLKGNKVTLAPNYRGFTKHLIASLKKLDGKALYLRDGNRCPGYGVRFECKNTVHQSDAESVMTMINSHLSVTTQGTNIPPAAAHLYFEHSSFSSDESVISASSSQVNLTRVGEDITDLPWRRPPDIIPKDVKGRQLYDSNVNVSHLNESKNKNKTQKSNHRSQGHNQTQTTVYTRHRDLAPPPPEPKTPPPPEKWDDNFIYETHGSPSKRVTTGHNGKRQPMKGGGSVGTGALRNAILGSQQYEPPPPPPPKVNRYPLTLGVDKAPLTLSDATIAIGNEVQKVPLLASPGMVDRLSPKKQTTTPLFPGAEQFWEGHVETQEHEERNVTSHVRDQVSQQHEENYRNKLANAVSPPPLPCEQFGGHYMDEESGDEEYDNYDEGGSYDESYGYDDRADYYSRSDDNYDSAQDYDDSREYYDNYVPYESGDSRNHQESDHPSPPHRKRDSTLTSQRRGTFFGLYSKDTPESKQNSRQSDLKRSDLSASKGPSSRATAVSQSVKKSPPKMTSQRRGTFFGLYKKSEVDSPEKEQSPVQSMVNKKPVKVAEETNASSRPAAMSPDTKSAMTSQRRGTFFGLYKKQDVDENQDQNKNQGVAKSTTAALFNNPSLLQKPTPSYAKSSPPVNQSSPNSGSKASPGKSSPPKMTSQRRGTFFGLYPSKGGQSQEVKEDFTQFNTIPQEEVRAQGILEEVVKESPEDLQSVLQQMYEKKIETLKNVKASRDQQPHPVPT